MKVTVIITIVVGCAIAAVLGITMTSSFDSKVADSSKSQLETKSTQCSGNALCVSGKITQIIDGDTVKVDGKSIRFSLVDAPELKYDGGQAKQFVEQVCPVGSEVIVDQDDNQLQDKYGRMLGVIYCNGMNLNQEILDSGIGDLYSAFCDQSEFATHTWVVKHGCGDSEDDLIEHMKNAVFYNEGSHYDYLPINNNPNMMAMEKIELQDDDSIDVKFGQNNYEWSTGYKPIPEFEYHANFKVNDTFAVLCTNIGKDGFAEHHPDLSEPYLPGLGIVKYLGPITVENEPVLLFWHESVTLEADIPCSYPEMIHHSKNLWELQELGLPTDSLENALGSNYQK